MTEDAQTRIARRIAEAPMADEVEATDMRGVISHQHDAPRGGVSKERAEIAGQSPSRLEMQNAGGFSGDLRSPHDGLGEGERESTGAHDELSIDRLNEEFALVMWGSKAIVIREVPRVVDGSKTPVNDRVRIWSTDAFKAFFANRKIRTTKTVKNKDTGDFEEKTVSAKLADTWLQSPERRTYDGVEFFPDPHNKPNAPKYLNLWRGFDFAPAMHLRPSERVRKYATFYDHLLNNICKGDERLRDWVFGWCAHMVQRPRERIGTAIVLRGREGTGKTKIGEIIGSLFESHYFCVDDPRYLTGQFNAHMASCLLLQVDEGFWAGDKAAEGRLKGLVTAKVQMIEAKGIDPIRLENYVRLLFSSNEDWVVPVGLEGRRYVVLDVGDGQRTNSEYFACMDAEMDDGGREALLADLLEFDLSCVNLRDVPKTEALLEQKLRSLDSVASWWFERLASGAATRRRGDWVNSHGRGGVIAIETLFNDYVHVAEKIGVRRKSEMTAFGMRMRKLVEAGGAPLRVVKRNEEVELHDGSTITKQVNCYDLPTLAACRAAFEAACGQKVAWVEDVREAAE